ncbi:vesicle-associated membrane protein 7-like [Plodia interpunctella]|uniref:vesicle-associated membrane protein 7-like n=1 Tax=Plodia interpunctella TaxID=58824 RepID=UPI002367D2CE|nr:vesicle-associated membrane protein 7-like [Plodia interpunctella]
MPILFSAVACDKIIKSKYASCDGNFTEIIEEVMLRLPSGRGKMTYFHGHYLFHYIIEDVYFYFCVTDKRCQRSRAFLFLNEIQRKFKSRGKDDFADILAAEMYRYSEDYNTITIRQGEIDELNSIGVDSSETILGEKILLINNTENLTYFSTISYVRKTPEKVEISRKNCRSMLYITVIVILVLILGFSIYSLEPMTCVIITCIFIIYFIRFVRNKTE